MDYTKRGSTHPHRHRLARPTPWKRRKFNEMSTFLRDGDSVADDREIATVLSRSETTGFKKGLRMTKDGRYFNHEIQQISNDLKHKLNSTCSVKNGIMEGPRMAPEHVTTKIAGCPFMRFFKMWYGNKDPKVENANLRKILNEYNTKDAEWSAIFAPAEKHGYLEEATPYASRTTKALPDKYLNAPEHPFMRTLFRANWGHFFKEDWLAFFEVVMNDPRVHHAVRIIQFNQAQTRSQAHGTPHTKLTMYENTVKYTATHAGMDMDFPEDIFKYTYYQMQHLFQAMTEMVIREILDHQHRLLIETILSEECPWRGYFIRHPGGHTNMTYQGFFEEFERDQIAALNKGPDGMHKLIEAANKKFSCFNPNVRSTGDMGMWVTEDSIIGILENPLNRRADAYGKMGGGLHDKYEAIRQTYYKVRDTYIFLVSKHRSPESQTPVQMLHSYKEESIFNVFPTVDDFNASGIRYMGGRTNIWIQDGSLGRTAPVFQNVLVEKIAEFYEGDTRLAHEDMTFARALQEFSPGFSWRDYYQSASTAAMDSVVKKYNKRWTFKLVQENIRKAFDQGRLKFAWLAHRNDSRMFGGAGMEKGLRALTDAYLDAIGNAIGLITDDVAFQYSQEFQGRLFTMANRMGMDGHLDAVILYSYFSDIIPAGSNSWKNDWFLGRTPDTDTEISMVDLLREIPSTADLRTILRNLMAIVYANHISDHHVKVTLGGVLGAVDFDGPTGKATLPELVDSLSSAKFGKAIFDVLGKHFVPLPFTVGVVRRTQFLTASFPMGTRGAYTLTRDDLDVNKVRCLSGIVTMLLEGKIGIVGDGLHNMLVMKDGHYRRAKPGHYLKNSLVERKHLVDGEDSDIEYASSYGHIIPFMLPYNTKLRHESVVPITGRCENVYRGTISTFDSERTFFKMNGWLYYEYLHVQLENKFKQYGQSERFMYHMEPGLYRHGTRMYRGRQYTTVERGVRMDNVVVDDSVFSNSAYGPLRDNNVLRY